MSEDKENLKGPFDPRTSASFTATDGFCLTFGIDYSGGSTYVAQGRIVDIKGGSAKCNFANISLLNQKFDTYLPANVEPGTFDLTLGWDPSDVGTGAVYGALASAYALGSKLGCQITVSYPSSSTAVETFQAYVADVGRVFTKKNMNMLDIKLQISGDPGFAGV